MRLSVTSWCRVRSPAGVSVGDDAFATLTGYLITRPSTSTKLTAYLLLGLSDVAPAGYRCDARLVLLSSACSVCTTSRPVRERAEQRGGMAAAQEYRSNGHALHVT